MLNNDGKHNGQNAYADKEQEIYNYNIYSKHKCVICFAYIIQHN